MLAILASALVILAPPAKLDRGIPADYTVTIVPFSMVTFACRVAGLKLTPKKPGDVLMGCINAEDRRIILPKEDTEFPYDHACWLMNARHEGAHAWEPKQDINHRGWHTYVCSPKQ